MSLFCGVKDMFYNNHALGFIILNVLHIKRPQDTVYNKARSRSAISFRISGHTKFSCLGEELLAQEGTVAYIPSGVDYKRVSSENEELIIIHLKNFGEDEKCIQVFDPKYPIAFSEFFYRILDEWEQRKPGYEHRCTSLLYQLFEKLEVYEETYMLEAEQRILSKGLVYLNMHFDEPGLTVSDLAGKCNISEVYFRRLYKAAFGISPLKAIQKMKLERACSLLESGYFTIGEVAEKSGFPNSKYFSAFFKKEMGKTPMAYLKSVKTLR